MSQTKELYQRLRQFHAVPVPEMDIMTGEAGIEPPFIDPTALIYRDAKGPVIFNIAAEEKTVAKPPPDILSRKQLKGSATCSAHIPVCIYGMETALVAFFASEA